MENNEEITQNLILKGYNQTKNNRSTIFISPKNTPYFVSYMFTSSEIKISISRGFERFFGSKKGIIRQLEKDLDEYEDIKKIKSISGNFGKFLRYELPIQRRNVEKTINSLNQIHSSIILNSKMVIEQCRIYN